MTPTERQTVMDIADLQINRYFDHYLTSVFPIQQAALMESHNKDATAHTPRFDNHIELCPVRRKIDRIQWMLLGGSAVGGAVVTVLIQHLVPILKAIL